VWVTVIKRIFWAYHNQKLLVTRFMLQNLHTFVHSIQRIVPNRPTNKSFKDFFVIDRIHINICKSFNLMLCHTKTASKWKRRQLNQVTCIQNWLQIFERTRICQVIREFCKSTCWTVSVELESTTKNIHYDSNL
jgi:hypothetical protein